MISKKLEIALNHQLKIEEDSSRIYLAMASWCENQGYAGAAAFLYSHSEEERFHQTKLLRFINERGGYAVLQELSKTKSEFISLQQLFEEILKHEEFVTKSINDLYELCVNEKDYTISQFLQWYIQEQVEEEGLIRRILDKFKLIGNDKSNLYHMDKELESMAIPVTGKA